MSADGSDVAELTHANGPRTISWSPDGSRLLYVDGHQVFILGLDGSAPVRLVRAADAAWSPDGNTIVYLSRCDVRATTSEGLHDRSLVDLRSVKPETAWCSGGGIVWSPDGRKLAALAPQGLLVMNADGSHARLVPARLGGVGLTWQPVP
jgi:Tol biopolymer transport system component